MELSIAEQLKSILLKGSNLQKCQKYRFCRTKTNKSSIEDVYDGELYQEHFRNNGFLSNPNSISLLGNTDGVSLIRSTKMGVWPIYLVINELPPKERFSRANRIFAGLWFGKGKPNFQTFLRPFALSIRELQDKGIQLQEDSRQVVNVRAMFLDSTLDAPAKALFMCMKQFNGYFGCGKCKAKGEQLCIGTGKNGAKRQCHIYPLSKETAATTGHAEARTNIEFRDQGIQVAKQLLKGIKKVHIMSVFLTLLLEPVHTVIL